MNERTHFFIKIFISHTFFSKGLMFLWCVRDCGDWGRLLYRPNFFSWPWHAELSSRIYLALLPHLGWICSTGGRKLVLPLAFRLPTNSTAASICLYPFITPSSFRFFSDLFTHVHLWLTAPSWVNIQQWVEIGFIWSVKMSNLVDRHRPNLNNYSCLPISLYIPRD